jgi:hypothetical protein
VPKQRQDRIGLLVVRAFVEEGRKRTILIRLLEVDPPGPDRVIGTAISPKAAARLVERWLDSLRVGSSGAGDTQRGAAGAER